MKYLIQVIRQITKNCFRQDKFRNIFYYETHFFIFRNKTEKIADVIVKMGPFLKLYSWFIHDFESNLSLLEESKKKYPLFAQSVKEFEVIKYIIYLFKILKSI